MGLTVSSRNLYFKVLASNTPECGLFGESTFKKIIKVKCGHTVWVVSQYDFSVLIRRGDQDTDKHRGKTMQGCSEKAVLSNPGERLQKKSTSLTPRSQTCSFQNCEKINVCV